MKNKILYGLLRYSLLAMLTIIGSGLLYGWYQSEREIESMAEKISLLENLTKTYQEDINRYLKHMEKLSEYEDIKGRETRLGFIKKGGVYLIEDEYQMGVLARVIAHGGEIETGVRAAEASYRLQNNIILTDWFTLGTNEYAFNGRFDGDNHSVTGKFASKEKGPASFMILGEQAKVENLQVQNNMNILSDVKIRCKNSPELERLINNLVEFPECRPKIYLQDYDLDTTKLAYILKRNWDNNESNGCHLEVKFLPEESRNNVKPKSMEPFIALPGNEMRRYIQKELEDADSFLYFIRLEEVEDLKCCTFVIKKQEWEQYHVLLEGSWDGKEVPLQHLVIPWYEMTSDSFGDYHIQKEDINFDGKNDLLIHAGSNWGSGGSWGNYRGIIWNGAEFEYYPSFPPQLVYLEFHKRQMISCGQCGVFNQYVLVYEVVDGKYELTKKLEYQIDANGDGKDLLYYYEMGSLVREHVIENGYDEVKELYPDLDYWR